MPAEVIAAGISFGLHLIAQHHVYRMESEFFAVLLLSSLGISISPFVIF